MYTLYISGKFVIVGSLWYSPTYFKHLPVTLCTDNVHANSPSLDASCPSNYSFVDGRTVNLRRVGIVWLPILQPPRTRKGSIIASCSCHENRRPPLLYTWTSIHVLHYRLWKTKKWKTLVHTSSTLRSLAIDFRFPTFRTRLIPPADSKRKLRSVYFGHEGKLKACFIESCSKTDGERAGRSGWKWGFAKYWLDMREY